MNQKKKLAIVTTHPIQYYAPLFKMLTDRGGIQLKVFYTWQQGASEYDERFGKTVKWDIPLCEGYDYEFVSNNNVYKRGFFDLKNPSLISDITDWGADGILVYGWNFFSHLKAMYYFKGKVPVLFRGDSTLLNEKKGIRLLARRLLLKLVYRNIDYALYVGQNNKEYFVKHGLKNDQLIFNPHAVDNARFKFEDSELNSKINYLKNELNISANDIVFLYAGKFYEVKNLFTLIAAFKKVPYKNARLILLGNGVQETKLRELAAGDQRIIFTGFRNQSEMPVVYRVGDVFVLPSKSETWGLAVNEAMACGRAILVSDKVGCAPDLVKSGYNGYIFSAGNIDALVSCFSAMIDKTKVKRMGKASEQIISKWSFKDQAQEIERLVERF
jgi:glycosyltransferase involved in cell wall biosynthesis